MLFQKGNNLGAKGRPVGSQNKSTDVLEVPKWNFTERVEYDQMQYIHGEAGTARTKS